ncbi:hypothetical protein MSAN_00396100 [Mycena sanguinolenta]|uniref:F-box protein n=1 Tax=Mycena sanguinolenta TaxID=230812 RepID=A0A8H6ZCX3_9AGAR|nr:hypothetical protein MSAN_00396100 [Mycena sanguinolenta]
MAVLPQELFDAIIDEAREDKNSEILRRCCIISLAFSTESVSRCRDQTYRVLALRLAQNIQFLFVSGGEVGWGLLGNEVTSALFDCLTWRSLRRLILVRMPDVPAAFISATLANVSAVSLFEVRVDSKWKEMEYVSNSAPTPRLRHLVLQDFTSTKFSICDFLFHPRNLAYIHQIECLTLRLAPKSASHDERIIAACAKSLKSLFILHLQGKFHNLNAECC